MKNLQNLREFLGYKRPREKNVFIYGHSGAGVLLASKLQKLNYKVKYVEPDETLCHELARKLENVQVVNFDAVNREKLLAEGLERADYFFAVGQDLSKNFCASLLAGSNGIGYTFCFSPRSEYVRIFESRPEIFAVLCPTLVVANHLYRFAHVERVSTYFSFRNSQAELYEMNLAGAPASAFEERETGRLVPALVKRGDRIVFPKAGERLLSGDRPVYILHSMDRRQLLSRFDL